MEQVYRVGQRVAVNIGGCRENRTQGVIRSIRERPHLTTYQVDFPQYRRDSRIEAFYMADDLLPADRP
jgi:hypothetical protein